MAAKNLPRDEVLDVLDDWSASDAGGISSAEEEDLDRQFEESDDSSRQVFFVCFTVLIYQVIFAYDAFVFYCVLCSAYILYIMSSMWYNSLYIVY